jgi:hypothetical protein
MSTPLDAEIGNAVVSAAVLEADRGAHREVTAFRILRPLAPAVQARC